MVPKRQHLIRSLFDEYIEMYASRDDRLIAHFSENFSGYTGGGDFLVKDRAAWLDITRLDFAQVTGRIRIEMQDISMQDIGDDVVIVTALFHIHLPFPELILSRKAVRLVLVFRLEDEEWKIVHSGISVPYQHVGVGEVYPIKSLQAGVREIDSLIQERTQVLERRAEVVALDALQQQAVIFDLAPAGIVGLDLDRRVTYWNRGAEELYGWLAAEAQGQVMHELLKTTFNGLQPIIERALLERGAWEGELHQRRRDGLDVIVFSRQAVRRDADGQPLAIVEINTDVSERFRTAAALQESETRLRAILDNTPSVMFLKDLDGRYLSTNRAFEQLLGLAPEQAYGKTDAELFEEQTAVALRQNDREVVQSKQPVQFEIAHHNDGPRTSLVMKYPLLDVRGEPYAVGGIATDITEWKNLQIVHEHDRVVAEQLAVVDQLKDQFVSMVSHELRTPMNGVVGMTDLLLETSLDVEQREFAETIRDSGRALVVIVNDILDLSRLEHGDVELEETALDVRSVVEHIVELLSGPARRKGVDLFGLVNRTVPHVLRGDPGRLSQVLTNLVGNAIKFTDHGEVSLQIGTVVNRNDALILRCEVHDNGIGIEPNAIEHLFKPFKQADSSVTRRYGGTGLGLAISKRLVEAMGGEIGVVSEPGHGSTFWFSVCLKQADAELSPPVSRSVQDLHVLLIDPNPLRRSALCEQLAAWGVPVQAQDCVRHATADRSTAFDVVLLTADALGQDVADIGRQLGVSTAGQVPRLVWLNPHFEATDDQVAGVWATLPSPHRRSQLFDLLAEIADQKQAGGLVAPRSVKVRRPVAAAATRVAADAPLVLVVDDVEVNRRVAERMLTRLGYRTISAESGLVALDQLTQHACAAVLMDCRMPDMDGFTATAEIRRRESDVHHTPIVAMTAHANSSDRVNCIDAGMDDYLSKPVELARLRAMMARWAPITATEPVAVPHPVTSSPGGGVLNLAALEEIRALDLPGQPSLLVEMVAAFGASLGGNLGHLKEAVALGDAEAVRNTAHALKGAAATIGAERVRALALELEIEGREHTLAGCEQQLADLDHACEQGLAALSQELLRTH